MKTETLEDTSHRNEEMVLTNTETWETYYEGRSFAWIEKLANRPALIDSLLRERKGRLFELGCGASTILARSAHFGWEVSGIDLNASAVDIIGRYLEAKGLRHSNIISDDVFKYNCDSLISSYDLLVSFGFLEHFSEPSLILLKWSKVVKEDGLIISVVPNLLSLNGMLLRKFDPASWNQHVVYSAERLDQIHRKAGLKTVINADYVGKYDINHLVPWTKIQERIGNKLVFKFVRYFSYYAMGKALGVLPKKGLRLFDRAVMGVYARN